MKRKKYLYFFSILLIFSVAFLIFVAYQDSKHNSIQYRSPKVVQQWLDYNITSKGNKVEYEGDIYINPDKGNILAFYSVHQNIVIYLDDEEIYKCPKGSVNSFARTPGINWNFVELPDGNNHIRVKFTSPYADYGYLQNIDNIYIGNMLSIITMILKKNIVAFFMSLITFVIGVLMVIYWFFARKKFTSIQKLLPLGIFAILLSIWAINENCICTLIIGNNIVGSYLSYVSLLFLQLPLAFFVRNFYNDQNKYWDVFYYINCIQICGCLLLQVFKVADFRETFISTNVIVLLLAILIFYSSYLKLKNKEDVDDVVLQLFSLLVCVIALSFDLCNFYFGTWKSNSIGKIGFLFYIIVLGIASMRESIELITKGKKAETYQHLAYTDQMTGLSNRAEFDKDFEKLAETPDDVTVILYDLNNLKKINDVQGHAAGDSYIINAARIINDIFSGIGKCYRVGGDEFVTLIQKTSDVDIVFYLAMFESHIDNYNKSNPKHKIVIAVGQATYNPDVETRLKDTYNRADQLMYVNKKEKKERK